MFWKYLINLNIKIISCRRSASFLISISDCTLFPFKGIHINSSSTFASSHCLMGMKVMHNAVQLSFWNERGSSIHIGLIKKERKEGQGVNGVGIDLMMIHPDPVLYF